MSQHDPTPKVPVFRLVQDTVDLPANVRYRLGLKAGFIEMFMPAAPSKQGMN